VRSKVAFGDDSLSSAYLSKANTSMRVLKSALRY
jgi:hypothetical protein